MRRELRSVNVEEGFFPQFDEAFREHYGPDSLFVRATADTFTLALSKLMSSSGRLAEQTSVPVLAPVAARESVSKILRTIWEQRTLLLQEACGVVPIGAFGAAVDKRLGANTFACWLSALEAQVDDSIGDLIPESGPSEGA